MVMHKFRPRKGATAIPWNACVEGYMPVPKPMTLDEAVRAYALMED